MFTNSFVQTGLLPEDFLCKTARCLFLGEEVPEILQTEHCSVNSALTGSQMDVAT